MKKLIVILFAAGMLAASCGDGTNRTSGANTDEVEDNAGEVLTPEADDMDSMNVDTLSTPAPGDSIR